MPLRRLLAAVLLFSSSSAALADVDPALFQDLHWRLLGPFRGGRVLAVTGIPASEVPPDAPRPEPVIPYADAAISTKNAARRKIGARFSVLYGMWDADFASCRREGPLLR